MRERDTLTLMSLMPFIHLFAKVGQPEGMGEGQAASGRAELHLCAPDAERLVGITVLKPKF